MPRLKKMVSYALAPELLERLDVWLAAQDPPPSKTAVVETALREFLEKREPIMWVTQVVVKRGA